MLASISRRSARFFFATALALLVLEADGVVGQTLSDPNLTITTHGSNFSAPTQLRFLGDDPNDYFVTEKNTGIVKAVINGVASTALDLNVANDSERGLLGIALHPGFSTNKQVYLYYSARPGGDGPNNWTDNRLERFLWNGTTLTADGSFPTVTFGSTADLLANGPNHDAGPILFGPGPNAKLYGTTGDLNRDAAEQNNTSASTTSAKVGGIYRLNDDGTAAADNPFFANANPDFRRWYAYGVRNTYGAAFDPATGNLWDTENGLNSYDEINLVASGFNSGWDSIMGPDARNGANAPADLVNLPGSTYSDPEFSFLTPVAVTGIEFLIGSALGSAYDNAVVVGAANTGELYLLRLNGARTGFVLSGDLTDLVADSTAERNAVLFGQNFGNAFQGVVDLQVGPDGGLYVVSLGRGVIYRIAAVPEPASLIMLTIAAIALLRHRRR